MTDNQIDKVLETWIWRGHQCEIRMESAMLYVGELVLYMDGERRADFLIDESDSPRFIKGVRKFLHREVTHPQKPSKPIASILSGIFKGPGRKQHAR
jgi:hypothetical protein